MRIAFSGCKAGAFVSKSANFAHQLRMLAQQFEQDDGGLVRLGLAAFIFRKRTGSTAEDTTGIGLAKMKFLAVCSQGGSMLLIHFGSQCLNGRAEALAFAHVEFALTAGRAMPT